MRKALQWVLAATMAALSSGGFAQPYPSKPIKLVVPQAAGGATDVFARHLAQKLSIAWSQAVVVENRVGAAGVVGTDFVAKSPADGYTLLFTYAGSQAVNPSLYPKIPFDSVKDFATITPVATTAFFLVVGANSPVQNFRELLANAKANPGKVTYATSGNGSINHLLSESLNVEVGIKTLHVPYKAISAAMTDVIGGQVETAFAAVPSALQLIKGGKLRAIGVSSAKRNNSMPDVPTIAEMGYPQFNVSPWWGLLAPAGTPKAVIDKIHADVVKIVQTPEGQNFFREQGSEVFTTSPEEFRKILEADVVNWAKVVKSSGAKLD
jgi:tripartite-type tricarboxylate transporter receptor subunit TctC